MKCCIVVKHLGRAELGMGDSPSQSPPIKRSCPDVQVSLALFCPPLGSNCLLPAQKLPDILFLLPYNVEHLGSSPRSVSPGRTGWGQEILFFVLEYRERPLDLFWELGTREMWKRLLCCWEYSDHTEDPQDLDLGYKYADLDDWIDYWDVTWGRPPAWPK